MKKLAILSIFALSFAAHAGPVVIVSAKSSVGTLTADQAEQIFLGKTLALPGGASAKVYDLKEGSPVRSDFYSKVSGKTDSQLKAYWSKIVFSGKGQPPQELTDGASVKKAVAGDPNAIGYIDSAEVDGTVKVVLTP